MSSEKQPRDGRRLTSASDATERLAAIVEAAEKAASAVIDDAEEQARRHIEEARERADRVVAERLRELADELDPQGQAPAGGDREQAPSESGERRLRPVQPAPEPDEPRGPRRSASAGARLLATQMAISGASRDEIEERLRNGFDIEDTGEILEAILGPEE